MKHVPLIALAVALLAHERDHGDAKSLSAAVDRATKNADPTRVLYAEAPTKVWYAEIANTVQNLLTNSPLNEGKKAVVKMLAGPYDEVAVRAKLDGLIAAEPVLMLSFVR